jgi:hypothetical protein
MAGTVGYEPAIPGPVVNSGCVAHATSLSGDGTIAVGVGGARYAGPVAFTFSGPGGCWTASAEAEELTGSIVGSDLATGRTIECGAGTHVVTAPNGVQQIVPDPPAELFVMRVGQAMLVMVGGSGSGPAPCSLDGVHRMLEFALVGSWVPVPIADGTYRLAGGAVIASGPMVYPLPGAAEQSW